MTVAIIGSRKSGDLTVEDIIKLVPKECSHIISGGAIGVDSLAKKAAKKLNIPITEILPCYEQYGKFAPLKRNKDIVEKACLILAFWDYHSTGTKNALEYALKLDKQIKLIKI